MGIETVRSFYEGDYNEGRIPIKKIIEMTLHAIQEERYDEKINTKIIRLCDESLRTISKKERLIFELIDPLPHFIRDFHMVKELPSILNKIEREMEAIKVEELNEDKKHRKIEELVHRDKKIIVSFFKNLREMFGILRAIQNEAGPTARRYITMMCHIDNPEKLSQLSEETEDLTISMEVYYLGKSLEEEEKFFRAFIEESRQTIKEINDYIRQNEYTNESINRILLSRPPLSKNDTYARDYIERKIKYLSGLGLNLQVRFFQGARDKKPIFETQKELIKTIRYKETMKMRVIRAVEELTKRLLPLEEGLQKAQ